MTTKTRNRAAIDWSAVIAERQAELTSSAASRGVSFGPRESDKLIALTIRLDAEEALAQARSLTLTRPEAPVVQPGTVTAVGVAEVLRPDGPYLLLRRGNEAWLVPDQPDGWDYRQPWLGDINSVRWIGGPPARAAFRRVGAPH